MKRLNFGVVTLTVTIFVILAGIISALRPFIPPQEPNELVHELGDYTKMGVNQNIKWQALSADAMAEARRSGRPLMLALGSAWSTDAERADRVYFSDPDVQSYLHRNFICIRLDLDRFPAYSSVLAPLGRIDNAFTVGFQLAFVRPDGIAYRFLSISGLSDDPADFLTQLVNAHQGFVANRTAEASQETERAILVEETAAPVPASTYIDNLVRFIDTDRGGFVNSPPTARMQAWKALLASGQSEAFDLAVAPYVQSGLVDWLDGGFFSRASDPDLRRVLFGKPSVFNAEVMHVLALGGHIGDNPYYTRLAKNAFDWLTGKAMEGDFVATAGIGQADRFGRSARTSISVKDMREYLGGDVLSRDEVLWARQNLGLRVEDNPAMVIKVRDPQVLNEGIFLRIIQKLRRHKDSEPLKFTSSPRADVNGIVLARLAACARLWDDRERLAICSRIFERLDKFRGGSDIAHILPYDLDQERYLGDYLAFADAALEMYLATGQPSYLTKGDLVLKRAHSLFASGSPGIWTPMPAPVKGPLAAVDVPEIVDNMGESLTAKMMRLAASYHRIKPSPALAVVYDRALDALNRYSGLLVQTGLLGGSLYCSTAFIVDDESALVVGPDSVKVAAELYRSSPMRLCAPALPEFPSTEPGVYILENGEPGHRLEPEAARALLPPILSPG